MLSTTSGFFYISLIVNNLSLKGAMNLILVWFCSCLNTLCLCEIWGKYIDLPKTEYRELYIALPPVRIFLKLNHFIDFIDANFSLDDAVNLILVLFCLELNTLSAFEMWAKLVNILKMVKFAEGL